MLPDPSAASDRSLIVQDPIPARSLRGGGDEFVLILPEIQVAAATAVLDRVRADVASVAPQISATMGAVVLRPGQRANLSTDAA